MEAQMKPSVASKAAKRQKLVTLQDWNTTDGAPMAVLCDALEGEDGARITGALPGERPQLGIPDGADREVAIERSRRILEISAEVIELGTSLLAEDGSEVRPAFHFGDPDHRHPLSLDGTQLSDTDLMQLSVGVLQCSGYLGGAAEARFLRGHRGRTDVVRQALEVLPGRGADAEAGAR